MLATVISHAAAAAKFASRIKTRRRMSITVGGRFVKILFAAEVRKIANEAIARDAQKLAPWSRLDNITNDILFATRYCGIVTARIAPGSRPTADQCIAICHDMMDNIPAECQWKSVFDVLDSRVVEILNHRLEAPLKARIYDSLRDVALPVTGAHGDLGCSNVLVEEHGSYKIIDWECFRQNGSCIEDLCRLLGTSMRSSSDPRDDVRDISQSRIMDVIEQRGYLTHDQCILLYVLSQASCELEKKDVNKVARRMTRRFCQTLAALPEAHPTRCRTDGLAAL